MRSGAVFTVLAISLVVGHAASAGTKEDSDRAAAREATKQATAAFNLGQYDEAATLYEQAYKLVPDPILLYDVGQSYRLANKLDKALIAYRSYLRTAPEDAPNRPKVEQWISELEWTSTLQSKHEVQKTEPLSPVVTQIPPAPAPSLAAPSPAPSSPARAASPAPAPPSTFARMDLVEQAPSHEPARPASWKKWAPWVGVGVTAVLGIATIAEWVSAKSTFSDLQGSCGKTKSCTDSQVSGDKSKVTTMNVLLGLTVVSAAATGVFFYINYSGGKDAGASLAWRY
jgi:tetratricopeptide (TPR) repeat protein